MSSSIEAVETALKVKTALTSIGSPPVDESNPTEVKGKDTDVLVTGVHGSWIYVAALVGIVSGVCSFVLVVSYLVDVSSLTLLILAPVAVIQKHKLSELGGLRGQHNELRQSVNTLSSENNKLSKNVSDMQSNVDDLKDVERQWAEVVKKSGGQADRLVNIVQENEKIQTEIKRNLEAQVLQDILSLALKNDRDGDFTFSKDELKRLKMSLSNIPGVTLDNANFDKFVGGSQSLSLPTIMAMFRNLKNDDIPEKDNIFHITPEKIIKKSGFF